MATQLNCAAIFGIGTCCGATVILVIAGCVSRMTAGEKQFAYRLDELLNLSTPTQQMLKQVKLGIVLR